MHLVEAYLAELRDIRKRLGAASEALDSVLSLMQGGEVVCLLCYEADALRCHRSLVADALAWRTHGLVVRHL